MKIRKSQLSADELDVLNTIQILNGQGRTTNNSQIASNSVVSRTAVAAITSSLRGWKLITDVSKGSAYHWRVTAAGRQLILDGETGDESPKDAELIARQRELNEQLRKDRERPYEPCAYSEAKTGTREQCAADGCHSCQTDLAEAAHASWTVTTFSGLDKVGEGTWTGPLAEELARDTARRHREHGFTTRVRPTGLTECCDSCS